MKRNLFVVSLSLILLAAAWLTYTQAQQRGITVVAPDGTPVGGKIWLLVIGINKYAQWPNLQGSVPDAKGVKDTLLSRYVIDEVIERYDAQATSKGIESAFRQLKRSVKPDDEVLIYYSGHGNYDQEMNAGYWIPHDAERDSATTWFPDSSIRNFIQGLSSRHVLLISDSCFSGDFFRSSPRPTSEPEDKYYSRIWSRLSRKAITSGSMELVADVGLGGHSPFAYFVIDSLKTNKKPYLSPSTLFEQIKEGVANNSEQEPRYGLIKDAGDGGGEFIFFLKPAQASPTQLLTSGTQGTKTNPTDGAEMVWIPGGSFKMGGDKSDDEEPVHSQTVGGFWMYKHEVTVAQYRKFCQATNRKMQEQPDWNKDNHPVVKVSWEDAQAYCQWARVRLPTEAEWEYAARGGRQFEYGTSTGELSHDLANYSGTQGRDQWENTSPVGSFPANPFGLYDMAGNVWEWCQDWYDGYPGNNKKDDEFGQKYRVLRGGSWSSGDYGVLRAAVFRTGCTPVSGCGINGFRCCQGQ